VDNPGIVKGTGASFELKPNSVFPVKAALPGFRIKGVSWLLRQRLWNRGLRRCPNADFRSLLQSPTKIEPIESTLGLAAAHPKKDEPAQRAGSSGKSQIVKS
jgi:hypothetical protein